MTPIPKEQIQEPDKLIYFARARLRSRHVTFTGSDTREERDKKGAQIVENIASQLLRRGSCHIERAELIVIGCAAMIRTLSLPPAALPFEKRIAANARRAMVRAICREALDRRTCQQVASGEQISGEECAPAHAEVPVLNLSKPGALLRLNEKRLAEAADATRLEIWKEVREGPEGWLHIQGNTALFRETFEGFPIGRPDIVSVASRILERAKDGAALRNSATKRNRSKALLDIRPARQPLSWNSTIKDRRTGTVLCFKDMLDSRGKQIRIPDEYRRFHQWPVLECAGIAPLPGNKKNLIKNNPRNREVAAYIQTISIREANKVLSRKG